MPNLYTLTGDVNDLVGGASVASTAHAYLESNIKGDDALTVTSEGGGLRLGTIPVTVEASSGLFTRDQLVGSDSTDLNVEPGVLQYRLIVEYRDPGIRAQGNKSNRTYRSGWFFLNASDDIKNLPKSVNPVVAATGAEIIAAASTEADRAEAAAAAAVAPTDTQVATLAQDPTSETGQALSATFAPAVAPPRSVPLLLPPEPDKKVVSVYQAGHGWTATNGGTGTNLNDTTDVALGAQSVRLVSRDGGSTPATTLDSPALPAVNLTGRELAFLVKLTGNANITDLRLYVGDAGIANAKNISLRSSEAGTDTTYLKDGDWTWITISALNGSNIGTPNLSAVTHYRWRLVAAAGTQATLQIGGIFYRDKTSLDPFPYGAASFTYDDGRISGLNYGKKRLDLYGWAGTVYPIIDRIGNPGGGTTYATVADLKALQDKSGWEISCHSHTAAQHDAGFSTLATTDVEANLFAERKWFYDQGLHTPSGFAWPRGMSTKAHEDAARKVVSYGRGIYTDGNTTRETLPPANLMRLRALSIGSGTSLTLLQQEADKASQNGDWIIYVFHDVVASGASTSLEANAATHDGIIDYIAGMTNAPKVLPVAEVLRRLR